ncbi:MAG TPA: hypothetical protein ENI33_00190 [Thermoplasmatales archaeon]|nr:hypothetical protein [Thermoplasmatales archaeon]
MNNKITKFSDNYLPFILVGLIVISVVLSVGTLVIRYQLGPLGLLMINTCIVGEILAVFALLLKNKTLAGISIPSLLWFGIGGRLNFSGSWLSAMHLTHVLMVLMSIYLVYLVWKVIKGKKRPFWVGIGIGVFLVLFLLFMMGWFYSTHPEAYDILLDVGWHGPEFR